ncbi:MAG: hypothetical protein AB8G11_20330 [Saprospiraceae bacterium]
MSSTTKKTDCKLFKDKPECLEFSDKRKTIICKDKRAKSVYEGRNHDLKTFCKYHLDSCLIKGSKTKKNDFLLINSDERKSYFIELKGSDLVKAIHQVDSSVTALQSKFKGYAIYGRIVLTRVNTTDLRSSEYRKLKKRLERTGGNLKQESQKMIEHL